MRKKQEITDATRRKNLITEISIFSGAFMFFGLHWGVVYREMSSTVEEGESIFLDSLNQALEHITTHPLRVLPAEPACVGVAAFAAIVVGIYLYSQYLRVKGTTTKAHGDAAFETRYDLYDREFVYDPAIIAEGLGGGLGTRAPKGETGTSHEARVPVSPAKTLEKITTYNEEHKRVVKRKYLRRAARIRVPVEGMAGVPVNCQAPEGTGGARAERARGTRAGTVLDECRRRSQIYTDRISLSLNGKWTRVNSNTIVFGGSGTGKSRFFLEPNILQTNSSIIVTDPSGDVLAVTGDFLQNVMHYKVKVFNINDMTKSCRFNPLHYIRDERDIPMVVNVLMENVQTKKGGGGDADFWDKTTRALLCATIGYLYEVTTVEERHFSNVLELIRLDARSEAGAGDEVTEFDRMFRALGEADPTSYAYKQYLTYKEAPVTTALSIQISTTVLLSQFFDIDAFKNLTFKDEMEMDRIGEEPMAIFMNIPQADTTYSWIIAMFFSLLLKNLFAQGEARMAREGLGAPELAMPVRFLIDEAANIGKIPDLEHYLAVCRKYQMSIVPIFQNYSQVVTLYGKDTANSIVSNCDSFLFLGGVDTDTLRIVVERCGKETVGVLSQSIAVSGRGANSESKSQTGRDLMSRTQVEQMPRDTCLLFINGLAPFKTKKYRLERHPNYKYMAEAEGHIYENPYRLVYEDDEIEGVRVKAFSEEGYVAPRIKDSARRRALLAGMAAKVKELKAARTKLYAQHEEAQVAGNGATAIRLENRIKEMEEMIEHYELVIAGKTAPEEKEGDGALDQKGEAMGGEHQAGGGAFGVEGAEEMAKAGIGNEGDVKRETGLPLDFEILDEGDAFVGHEVVKVNTVV